MEYIHKANEFVLRYKQLIGDGKTHATALDIAEYEFFRHIDGFCTSAPTFFFTDRSGCDYIENEQSWQIFGNL